MPYTHTVQDEIWGRVERNFRFLKGLTQFLDQTESLGAYALYTARTKTASEAPNLARTTKQYFVTRRVRHLGGLPGTLVATIDRRLDWDLMFEQTPCLSPNQIGSSA